MIEARNLQISLMVGPVRCRYALEVYRVVQVHPHVVVLLNMLRKAPVIFKPIRWQTANKTFVCHFIIPVRLLLTLLRKGVDNNTEHLWGKTGGGDLIFGCIRSVLNIYVQTLQLYSKEFA